jgi:GDP-L-fucose synthase
MDEVLLDLKTPNIEDAQKILTSYGVTFESVEIWGTGKPMREFLWSEDMADACLHIMKHTSFSDLIEDDKEIRNTHINIGTGLDISIAELAEKIQKIVGFNGKLNFDTTKPDGTMRKVTDVSKIHDLGWKHTVELDDGIKKLYNWYISN